MVDTITSFTAGDLVVSLSGAANTTGTTYYDNQGTPLTLEELTTTGTVVGQLVLPQTTATVNGVTESAISAEYGSSSEGTLELSTDGTSLVIAGYGVNAATYNMAEKSYQPTSTSVAQSKAQAAGGSYGSGSLAQTYSVPNGGANGAPSGVAVTPRVIASISANGTVDTSTSLINVDNENNPRSVATTNGQTFYLSGQGKKGDTTQGVFLASDGQNNTSPTPIYTGVDTRTAELYGGTLYVSEDSSINPGTGGIYSFGGSPTGGMTPTILSGMTGSVALAAGQGNNVNGSSGTVDMSPENFFFANANTLYIADSGNPKGGTLGDGGLQKWSLNNGTWSLDYTLSSGLNLIPNSSTVNTTDTGYGQDASTGLIGLTGQVAANGTVSLYATNATIGDLNNTYVYGITDTLADTSSTQAAGESFTQLFQAPPDTNVRGIAFAPQSPVCFVSGTPIRTVRGDVAVEDLVVGDLVVTASGAQRPIKWLGHRTLDCRLHPEPRKVMPIRIVAHAFAPSRPARDVYVSPGHSICLDLCGEVLIPAHLLANGATIAQIGVERVTYWHVELDSHDILLAADLPCESYIDCGTRSFFAETDVVALDALPDGEVLTTHDYCRPFHADGAVVDFARERLCRRAYELGWQLETADPLGGLWLEVDGERVEPVRRGLLACATLPAGAREVWLCSHAAVPADIHGGKDTRRLGLQFASATADDGLEWGCEIGCGDARLEDGFYGHEGALRWTDGRARLPSDLWKGCRGSFALRLAFAGPALPVWTSTRPALEMLDIAV